MDGLKIFFSYAHADSSLQQDLRKHLSAQEASGRVVAWYDGMIGPGQDWRAEIDEQMERADIFLLLVSADFIASSFCKLECRVALERASAGKAAVIPVLLRHVDLTDHPLGRLQRVPQAGPVAAQEDRDAALEEVSRRVRDVAERLYGQPQTPAKRSRVPSLLPFLADRSAQRARVFEVLDDQRGSRAPVAFVLPGGEREKHERFVIRVCEETLPEVLGPAAQTTSRFIPWPPRETKDRVRYFRREMLGHLSRTGPLRADADMVERMARALDAMNAPYAVFDTIVHIKQVDASEQSFAWRWAESMEKLGEALDETIAGARPIIFISVPFAAPAPRGWMPWSTGSWARRRVERLTEWFAVLEKRGSTKFRVAVLPELMPVPREDAREWTQHPRLREWLESTRSTDRFLLEADAEIDRLYERQGPGARLSMSELGPALNRLLERYSNA
jgi:hypothetical protein